MFIPFRRANLDEVVAHYEREGFVILTDVDPRPAQILRQIVCAASGLTPDRLRDIGRNGTNLLLSPEARTALARPVMTPELQEVCLEVFGELLLRLLGPIIHVSQTFHPQIKSQATEQTILDGYSGDGLEVQAVYGFHQDFTAARVLTSPSAMVCWVPLNTCERNTLRVYPRSHRLGLLTNRWLPLDIPGIERLGAPIDVQAKEGQVLLFNFMLMHGGSNPGPSTRISCDLRFFPFCGIIDSAPVTLQSQPIRWIQSRLDHGLGDMLQAPLCETLSYCGMPMARSTPRPYSNLHWAKFLEAPVKQEIDKGLEATARWVNTEVGFDPVAAYQQRFAQVRLCERPFASIQHMVPEAKHVLECLHTTAQHT